MGVSLVGCELDREGKGKGGIITGTVAIEEGIEPCAVDVEVVRIDDAETPCHGAVS